MSGARAENPPIVSVGSVSGGGNTASADVDSNGKTDACVNDDASQADPSADGTGAVKLNQGSCQSTGASGSGSGGAQTATGSQAGGARGSTGSRSSTRGSSGSTRSSAGAAVTAGNAVGLKIVRVRHVTKRISVTKRLRVLVTLKDGRGKLVRYAIVTISKVPGARNTISGKYPTFSNRLGQASVRVPVAKHLLGKRLFLKISARTPKARTVTLRSVRLPATG